MKKSFAAAFTVAIVLLLACIAVLGFQYKQQGARLVETKQAEETVRTQFNAALESIAEIQDSLSAIAPTEGQLRRMSRQAETGSQVTETQKERMLSTISDLKQSIRNTGQRVRDLEKTIESNQAEMASLRRVVDGLKRTVTERENSIAQLTSQIDALNTQVASLQEDVKKGEETIAQQQTTITQNQQDIEQKRQEISTIYYVVGTKKELKTKGILAESGGVIGFGKSQHLTGIFNEADFTPVDTDMRSEILISGKEPRVMSQQRKGSFEIVPAGMEGQSNLRITDPNEFRKGKYLVVMVK